MVGAIKCILKTVVGTIFRRVTSVGPAQPLRVVVGNARLDVLRIVVVLMGVALPPVALCAFIQFANKRIMHDGVNTLCLTSGGGRVGPYRCHPCRFLE